MLHYTSKDRFPYADLPFDVFSALMPMVVHEHTHEYLEIVLVGRGSALHRVSPDGKNFRSCALMQGDVFSVMPGEVHEYRNCSDFLLYNLALKPEIVLPVKQELAHLRGWEMLLAGAGSAGHSKIHLSREDRESAETLLRRTIREFALRRPGFKLNAKLAFWEFLVLVLRTDPSAWTVFSGDSAGILRSIDLMENAPETDFRLENLARAAAMSVAGFTRKFREATGMSAMEYLLQLRLEKARILLEKGELPLAEVALSCGFCDLNHMIKLFRKKHGVTPGRYRREFERAILS